MTLAISFAVMAHPDRSTRAYALADQLSRFAMRAPIAWADLRQPGDVWGTSRKAWAFGLSRLAPDDWHVVVQDDAILADDFRDALQKILSARTNEDCVVSLFSFGPKPQTRWLELTGVTLYGVALAIPARLIAPMIAWIDTNKTYGENHLGWGSAPRTQHDDKRILDWTKSKKIPCYVAFPNIVDHDPGPSIANPKSRPRVSSDFLRSGATELDWTKLESTKGRK